MHPYVRATRFLKDNFSALVEELERNLVKQTCATTPNARPLLRFPRRTYTFEMSSVRAPVLAFFDAKLDYRAHTLSTIAQTFWGSITI